MRHLAIVAALTLMASMALAEEVVLNDGTKIQGKVTMITDEEVTIVVKVKKTDVKEIIRDKPDKPKDPPPKVDPPKDPTKTDPVPPPAVHTCKDCKGTGKVTCRATMCKDGKQKCWRCGSQGVVSGGPRDPVTGFDTKKTCPECKGAKYLGNCTFCNGTTLQTCKTCGGTGK
jgi:hypothetical protein